MQGGGRVRFAGMGRQVSSVENRGVPRRWWLFGVPVDAVTHESALARAVALVDAAVPGRVALVFTPNPETVMAARRDSASGKVLRSADLALPDGVGIAWAARRAGRPLPARVPGVEFLDTLLQVAAKREWPVYFLGAAPGVAAAAARRAEQRYPGLVVAGVAHGFFAPEEEATEVAAIRRSGAHLLFVGLGGVRQHAFLYTHRAEFGEVRLAMAVGGSLDVLSGAVTRAPRWVQRAGLEWLWRLLHDPGRWRRQLALPRFAFAVLRAGRACVSPMPPEGELGTRD